MNKKDLEKKLENTKDIVESVIQKAIKSGISQVEIFVSFAESGEVSLEKNDINTAVFSEETNFGVRVIENYCEGFMTTNDPTSLFDSVEQARTLAKAQNTPDPAMELPEPYPVTPVEGLYDTTLDDIDLEDIIRLASNCMDIKKSDFQKVNIDSGNLSFYKGFKYISTSKKISLSEMEAALSAGYMGMAVDGDDIGSFDHDGCQSRNMDDFRKLLNENFHDFLNRCMGFLGTRTIEGFKGPILIPPESIFSFLGDAITSLTAPLIRKGRSKLKDKLGKQVFSPLLTVYEDPRIPFFAGSTAFDREGIPTCKQEIITQGIVKNFLYNHFEAKKAGLEKSFGNATGGSSSSPSCGPRQLQILPGLTSLSDMLKPDEATIQIGRFSGSSDLSSGEFSGVVKGGFYLKGKDKYPVKEITISGNIYEALSRIRNVSQERKLLYSSSYSPYIIIDDIDISGKHD